MTEAEWQAADDPTPMLAALRAAGKLTDRKARLFACGCVRRIWPLLADERSRGAVEAAERYADGFARAAGLNTAYAQAAAVANALDHPEAADAAACTASDDIHSCVYPAAVCATRAVAVAASAEDAERAAQAKLLRDIFGPLLFREIPINAAWLAWNGGTVHRLAEAMYAERAFERMGVLADALEEAGCDNVEMLAHCRGPGPHARGCWVIDLLLNRG